MKATMCSGKPLFIAQPDCRSVGAGGSSGVYLVVVAGAGKLSKEMTALCPKQPIVPASAPPQSRHSRLAASGRKTHRTI